MTIEELIEQFRSAAIEKGDFASTAGRDRQLFDAMVQSWRALYERGVSGRRAFSMLLSDDSYRVRIWVAAQLLSESKVEAESVLEVEANHSGIRGLEARTVLKEWRAARLLSPFSSSGS